MEVIAYDSQFETQVIALWNACGLVKPWNDPKKDIQRKLDRDPELFLIGVENNQVIASVMGGYDGHRGWINYLAVAPHLRKTGYGRTIMSQIEEKLLALNCPKINLQVRTTNQAVIAFYEALGYGDDQVTSLGKRLIPDD